MSILSGIKILLDEIKEDLPILIQNAKTNDPRGVAIASLIGAHRFMGVRLLWKEVISLEPVYCIRMMARLLSLQITTRTSFLWGIGNRNSL